MFETVILSANYKIIIPQKVRDRQGWKPGMKIVFELREDGGCQIAAKPAVESARPVARRRHAKSSQE